MSRQSTEITLREAVEFCKSKRKTKNIDMGRGRQAEVLTCDKECPAYSSCVAMDDEFYAWGALCSLDYKEIEKAIEEAQNEE